MRTGYGPALVKKIVGEMFPPHFPRSERDPLMTPDLTNNSLPRTYAQALGGVLTLIGILGFIPGITPNAPDGNLIGLFAVNPLHNIIHILSGVVGLAAAYYGQGAYARWYAGIFGLVYGLVTIIGFIQGNSVLGLIPTNLADNLLHLLITASALYVFFTTGRATATGYSSLAR